jgi:uncharacterized protein YciI
MVKRRLTGEMKYPLYLSPGIFKIAIMQFVLTAYDGEDKDALDRRMKSRTMHLDKIQELKASGNFIFGGAILDDTDQMVGSMVVFEFPGWDEMEAYLETEPYVIGGVWRKIEVKPFRQAKI